MNRRLSCSYVSNNLEHLESRRLLSTVDVTSFGAKPNDGGDDKAAIQAAINASQPGDTILFPAGTYNFSDQVFLKGNRTYQGAGDSTVLQGDPARDIFHIQESGVTIQNFKFIGQPIIIDGGTISNVVINNNTLQVTATGPNDNGITFTTLLTNSSITNNTFSPINGFAGIYGYFWNNVTIANNEFINGEQGMHFDNLDNNGQNLLIEQNYFSGLHRMGVEYQGGGHNLILQDNYYENPNLSSNQADNGDTSAFSIVADQSTGTIARRNTIIAPQRPDGIGVRIDFETGGDGSQLYDNYVIGGSYFDANTDGNGTTSITTTNNHVENVLYQTLIGRGITASNNGPGVQVTWDINRGKPGRNKRYGSSSPAQSTPAPAPAPIPTSTQITPPVSTPVSTPISALPIVSAQAVMRYLSDLTWAAMTNGWGPAEKDQSNADKPANDGRKITLNGQSYAKGLGVHANSSITYNLNSHYTSFLSDIGVDDEVGSAGSVDFQVYLDKVKVYDSGVMTNSTKTKSIKLDVTGKKSLQLVVTDGGNGNASDHADWANARLVPASSTAVKKSTSPPPPTSNPLSTTTVPATGGWNWLSDLNWTSMTNGWGPAEKNESNGDKPANDGTPITLNGKVYAKGLGVHANSSISYNLNGKYKKLSTDIGVDDAVGNVGSVDFEIFLDDVKVFDSGKMTGSSASKWVGLDLAGKKTLTLVVTDGGDGNASDHADWAGAKIM